jgi:hypothetical protein
VTFNCPMRRWMGAAPFMPDFTVPEPKGNDAGCRTKS